MAYTKDQLFSFRFTTAVPVIPRSVRKTLFKLRIWNPRRHRVTPVVGTLPNISTAVPPTRLPVFMPRLRPLANPLLLRGFRAYSPLPASSRDLFETNRSTFVMSSNTWSPLVYDLRNMARESERSIGAFHLP